MCVLAKVPAHVRLCVFRLCASLRLVRLCVSKVPARKFPLCVLRLRLASLASFPLMYVFLCVRHASYAPARAHTPRVRV